MKKATKNNIKEVILDAIENAAKDYYRFSTNENLRQAPEYFINVYIARELTEKFDSLGIKLEMPVKEMIDQFDISEDSLSDELRTNGRFDLVVTTQKTGKPRHIIEVKRHFAVRAILKEASRIAALSQSNHGRKNLQSGFIVSIAKRKSSANMTPLELIDDRQKRIIEDIGDNFQVSALYDKLPFGKFGFADNEFLMMSVIEISLK